MKKAVALVLASSVSAGAAYAGNMNFEEPVEPVVVAPVAVVDTGYDWSGFYGGAQLGYGRGDVDGVGDTEGYLGGVHAGYNYDFGNWVIGGELDVDWADLEVDNTDATIDGIARLKLKGGYDFGRTLVYGTVGAAAANLSSDTLGDDRGNGYVAGLGVDYAVTDNWIVGAEYLYHDFKDYGDLGTDVNVNTLKAKVSYKF
ncbi:outer membrane protein [Oceanomicrobium pacificus]|uniref:Outer membrane beta-barrel protein n=1 Tax=Oceanomicrobium pacificus TaxID=2692916 RepID=A0A6B0TXB7_9RHOB|nr:outer membrane beta-barrel protein [Oceanomicrobium pacificus]MXU65942.1 outer membrane beta-barrel protein [Oceanomicrobium pacificus]